MVEKILIRFLIPLSIIHSDLTRGSRYEEVEENPKGIDHGPSEFRKPDNRP